MLLSPARLRHRRARFSRPTFLPEGPRDFCPDRRYRLDLGVMAVTCPHSADLDRRMRQARSLFPPPAHWVDVFQRPSPSVGWRCYGQPRGDDSPSLALLYDVWFTLPPAPGRRAGSPAGTRRAASVLLPGDSLLVARAEVAETHRLLERKWAWTAPRLWPSDRACRQPYYLRGQRRCFSIQRGTEGKEVFYLCTGSGVQLAPVCHAAEFLLDLLARCDAGWPGAHAWHRWRVLWHCPSYPGLEPDCHAWCEWPFVPGRLSSQPERPYHRHRYHRADSSSDEWQEEEEAGTAQEEE